MQQQTVIQTVQEFLADLDQFSDRVPLDELTRRLENLAITVEDVRKHVHFGRERYQRNLMHAGTGFQALILCWRKGQRSPIHDHHGSSCGVRVLEGTATETSFAQTPDGYVYATGSRELPPGAVCGSQDNDIHQVSNLQPGDADLITLHIYSPPLLHMGMYSLTDTEVVDFFDPVVGFSEGAGI